MTLVLGANLSDRIYLSGDTRLTVTDPKTDLISFHDNIMKVRPLTEYVNVAVAGNLNFATFIVNKIIKNFHETNITELRDKIEDFLRSLSSEIFKSYSGKSVCLLFGGIDLTRMKKIDGKKIIKLVGTFQTVANRPMNMKDVIFKGLMTKPSAPNPYPELPVAQSSLFAVTINKDGIKIVDTKWGDMLAYGSGGITKSVIPEEAFGSLEFQVGAGNMSSDFTMLVAIMKDMIDTSGNFKIGGSIFSMFSRQEGSGTVVARVDRLSTKGTALEFVNETIIQGGKVYSKNKKGVLTKLVPFTEYEDRGKSSSNDLTL